MKKMIVWLVILTLMVFAIGGYLIRGYNDSKQIEEVDFEDWSKQLEEALEDFNKQIEEALEDSGY